MDDPIGNHPTRAEQLDILTTIITDQAMPNNRVLDLGCGTIAQPRCYLIKGVIFLRRVRL